MKNLETMKALDALLVEFRGWAYRLDDSNPTEELIAIHSFSRDMMIAYELDRMEWGRKLMGNRRRNLTDILETTGQPAARECLLILDKVSNLI